MNLSDLKFTNYIFLISLLLLINFTACNNQKAENSSNKVSPFEKALKFNGKYIPKEVLHDEYNKFYERYKRNGEMLRKSDEERTEFFYEQQIDRLVLEDYLKKSGVNISKEELDDFIQKYVKSNFPSEESFNEYLSQNNFHNLKELENTSTLYLIEIKILPEIAKNNNVMLTKEELERKSNKTEEMRLTEKFLKSNEFTNWVKTLRKNVTYEITDITIKAYKFYKEQQYSLAAKEYQKAYKKYRYEFYKDKANECEMLAKKQ